MKKAKPRGREFVPYLIFLISLNAAGEDAMSSRSDGHAPMYSVTFAVSDGQRDSFFERLRRFADAQALAIRIAPITPNEEQYSIQMWRQDVKVIGNNALSPQEFYLGFYENGDHPAKRETVSEMVSDLKLMIGGIPSVTISDPE